MAKNPTCASLQKRVKELEQENAALRQVKGALEKRIAALTRPLKEGEDITFEDLFSIEDIQRIQDEFTKATGVASIITNTDRNPHHRTEQFLPALQ